MTERIIRGVSGALVILSTLLAVMVDVRWAWLAAAIGTMMVIVALTGTCPLVTLLNKFGVNAACPLKK